MTVLQTKPYALQGDDGQSIQTQGALVVVKANTEQTGGAFNLFEATCPPHYTTTLHIHYGEDVAIYVLAGTLTVFWGNEPLAAGAGTYLFQPSGTPHGFRVEGEAPARILYMTFPAGLDRFVLEQEPLATPADPATAAARYQIEIIGPLPA